MGPERATLLRRLQGRLPDATREALRRTVSLAEGQGVALYLVGGAVRDLLLSAPQVDVDLVVEGDALALASAVAEQLGARVVSHSRFATAVVRGEGFRLDLAQARAERYERPGALPAVRPVSGGLADDLARRDFTINAMALRLAGPRAGELIDPHGGRRDLAQRRVRVLHDRSFQDDATRILRALRYAGRLGFRLEPDMESLLRRDLCFLDTISGARLRHELEYIAAEERAAEILRRARDLGVLAAVHPALGAGETALRAAARLPELSPSHRDAVLFCLLLAEATPAEAEGAIDRLALTGRQAAAVRGPTAARLGGLLALRRLERRLARPSLRPSRAVAILESQPAAAVEALALLTEHALGAERARQYLAEWRFVRPRLNGHDIEALGVPHGPLVGAALASLREARLDGRARTREDEVALVRRMQAGRRPLAKASHG